MTKRIMVNILWLALLLLLLNWLGTRVDAWFDYRETVSSSQWN